MFIIIDRMSNNLEEKNDVFIFNFDFWFYPKSFVTENFDRLNLTHIKLLNLISHQLSPQ